MDICYVRYMLILHFLNLGQQFLRFRVDLLPTVHESTPAQTRTGITDLGGLGHPVRSTKHRSRQSG